MLDVRSSCVKHAGNWRFYVGGDKKDVLQHDPTRARGVLTLSDARWLTAHRRLSAEVRLRTYKHASKYRC